MLRLKIRKLQANSTAKDLTILNASTATAHVHHDKTTHETDNAEKALHDAKKRMLAKFDADGASKEVKDILAKFDTEKAHKKEKATQAKTEDVKTASVDTAEDAKK